MNIGIVNDLPLAVEALRRVIALRTDHRVLWVATDGDEAVDFCVAHPPDVVLMDLVMPKVDGWELMRALGALRGESRVPVVCVTASRTPVPDGCFAILRKPFHDHELVEAVRSAFARLRENVTA